MLFVDFAFLDDRGSREDRGRGAAFGCQSGQAGPCSDGKSLYNIHRGCPVAAGIFSVCKVVIKSIKVPPQWQVLIKQLQSRKHALPGLFFVYATAMC